MNVPTKICDTCDTEKILHEFGRKYNTYNEFVDTCKECKKKKLRKTELEIISKNSALKKFDF